MSGKVEVKTLFFDKIVEISKKDVSKVYALTTVWWKGD